MLIKDDWSEVYLPNKNETVMQMTKRYLDELESRNLLLPKNRTVYKREKLPKTLDAIRDPDEKLALIKATLKKWKYGTGDLSPSMYAYVNLFKIHKRSGGGVISPEFRVYDMHEFDLWRSAVHGDGKFYGHLKGKDILTVGARSKGKSAKIGINAITEAVFSENMYQFLFSKDSDSIDDFFKNKIVLPYSTLPEYIKPKHHSIVKSFGVGKDALERSYILGKVPVVEKAEGGGAKIVYYDEAPKTKNLFQIKEMTDGCLLGDDGFTKEGISIITGVAGDFDKFGTDFIDMWTEQKSYFSRWFIPAWAGMHTDDCGNEDIEHAVMSILQERYAIAKQKNESALLNALQKHPLSPDEALQTPSKSFINTTKVMFQYKRVLDDNTDYMRQGDFEWDRDKKNAIWRDSAYYDKTEPKINILELPPAKKSEKITADYVMYVDCYDIKDKMGEGSSGAAYVYKMPTDISAGKLELLLEQYECANNNQERVTSLLQMGGLPVLEYIDMPDMDEFNDRIAKIFTAYNCMALVEKLPSQTFNSLYKSYTNYLQYKPRKVGEPRLKMRDLKERGIKVDEYWKAERNRAVKWFVDHHYDRIFFPRLLKDMMSYDPDIDRKKHDSVDAFGGVIIHSQQEDLLRLVKDIVEVDYAQDVFFGVRVMNGVIQRG